MTSQTSSRRVTLIAGALILFALAAPLHAETTTQFDRATGVQDELADLRPRFRETMSTVAFTGTFIF